MSDPQLREALSSAGKHRQTGADARAHGSSPNTSAVTVEKSSTSPKTPKSKPTVVVDRVHLNYRILGKRRRGGAAGAFRRSLLGDAAPGQRYVHAVRGVTFTAYRGEAIGLIGPNGSGKSTLLRGIAGLMTPSRGAVWTSGQASLLGVSAAMMGGMSGEQNIILGCLAQGMTPGEIAQEYDSIAAFAGIEEFLHLPMSTYSSGMGARLRFAIAAARAPDILLIDEALATGDAQFRRRSEKRIFELRERAGTVFLVSHGLGIVRETCNRAIWLEGGKIVQIGEANAIVDAYERVHDPEAAAARAARQKRRSGVDTSVLDEPTSF